MRVVLVEATPLNPATGEPVPIALAGLGRKSYRHRGRNDWRAGVVTEPSFSARIEFGDSGFAGGAVPETGAIIWRPSKAAQLAEVAGLLWNGAAIEVFSGDDDDDAPAWTTLIKGQVEGMQAAGGALTLRIRDASAELDVPVAQGRFSGEGGIEGDEAIAGRIKRRSWGAVANVEARILRSATLVYEVGDPAFPLEAIVDLKDMGRSASSLVVVPWAGTVPATLAALEAAAVPTGGGAVAPSIACVRWWTQPVGPLTVDLKGEIGAGYVETAGAIAERIVGAHSELTVANVAEAVAWRPGIAGIHIEEGGETVAQALDRLLRGTSLAWLATAAGAITMREITLEAPSVTVRATEITRSRSFRPLLRRRVGYRRNHRIHSDGEISAVIPSDDRSLDDTFDPAYWFFPPGAERVTSDVSRSGWAAVIPFIPSTDFRIYNENTPERLARTHPGKALWARLTVEPDGASLGSTTFLFGGYNITLAGLTFAYGTGGGAGDFFLELAVERLDLDGAFLERIVIATINPALGTQTITARYVATDWGLARLSIGYPSQTGKAGQWTVYEPWFEEFEPAADNTAAALPSLVLVPAVKIDTNHAGAAVSIQPTSMRCIRRRGDLDVSIDTNWTAIFPPGMTATINNTPGSVDRGVITIDDFVGTAPGRIDISSERAGEPPLDGGIDVQVSVAPAPTGGGTTGGSISSDSSIVGTALSIYSAVNAGPIVVTAGSAGEVALTAPLSFRSNMQGQYRNCYGKAQWREPGGSWADVAAEVIGSPSFFDYNPYGWFVDEPGFFMLAGGTPLVKSGLVPGNDYEFRLLLRNAMAGAELWFVGTFTGQGR